MIALLPLRGWVGDAMATQMAVHSLHQAGIKSASSHQSAQSPATESIAASAGISWANGTFHHQTAAAPAAMPADCPEHASPVGSDGEGIDRASADSGSGCPDCAFCQACHTVALTSAAPDLSLGVHPDALPPPAAAQFASAEAALGQKPPIS